ncbi:MAG: hypothetical protein AVO35_09840 [Candidatus Aegiribacteria sp. MLS_C]|nr:MAG: hypothetical protein AVO35_09840 [Candidatus Aegiribacteria sp. MLS_C]
MPFFLALMLLAPRASIEGSDWAEAGDGYSISVHYSDAAMENRAIGDSLEAYVSKQVPAFRARFDEYSLDDPFMPQWNLEITFTDEPSPDGLVCVMAWTWEYSGGAHGNSWTRAFVYDLELEDFIGPVELLGGEEEFGAFADSVMARLNGILDDEGWIEEGASADPDNYHSLLPLPDGEGGTAGYRVIFPPYQVAAYVFGPIDLYFPPELGPEDI